MPNKNKSNETKQINKKEITEIILSFIAINEARIDTLEEERKKMNDLLTKRLGIFRIKTKYEMADYEHKIEAKIVQLKKIIKNFKTLKSDLISNRKEYAPENFWKEFTKITDKKRAIKEKLNLNNLNDAEHYKRKLKL